MLCPHMPLQTSSTVPHKQVQDMAELKEASSRRRSGAAYS